MHISLGVSILPVFEGFRGCIFHWGSLYCRYFGYSADPYFSRGPYTAGVWGTPGMHTSLGVLYSRCFGDFGDAYSSRGPYTPSVLGTLGIHISLGIPILHIVRF
jgi:hypothetical protein